MIVLFTACQTVEVPRISVHAAVFHISQKLRSQFITDHQGLMNKQAMIPVYWCEEADYLCDDFFCFISF